MSYVARSKVKRMLGVFEYVNLVTINISYYIYIIKTRLLCVCVCVFVCPDCIKVMGE